MGFTSSACSLKRFCALLQCCIWRTPEGLQRIQSHAGVKPLTLELITNPPTGQQQWWCGANPQARSSHKCEILSLSTKPSAFPSLLLLNCHEHFKLPWGAEEGGQVSVCDTGDSQSSMAGAAPLPLPPLTSGTLNLEKFTFYFFSPAAPGQAAAVITAPGVGLNTPRRSWGELSSIKREG